MGYNKTESLTWEEMLVGRMWFGKCGKVHSTKMFGR
jgi:hypothetical protein